MHRCHPSIYGMLLEQAEHPSLRLLTLAAIVFWTTEKGLGFATLHVQYLNYTRGRGTWLVVVDLLKIGDFRPFKNLDESTTSIYKRSRAFIKALAEELAAPLRA